MPGMVCSSVSVDAPRAYEWTMRITPITAFNTRVPAERYEATMNNRTSARVADGSDNPDYYVTLTVYHELHCLVSVPIVLDAFTHRLFDALQMRFRWFLDPQYYANMTWEEQAQDKFTMGHYSESRSSCPRTQAFCVPLMHNHRTLPMESP
jgi:hypothetical protein